MILQHCHLWAYDRYKIPTMQIMKQKYRKWKGQMWKTHMLIWLSVHNCSLRSLPSSKSNSWIWYLEMLCHAASNMPTTYWGSMQSNTSCVFSSILRVSYPKLIFCYQGRIHVGTRRCILYYIYLSMLLKICLSGIWSQLWRKKKKNHKNIAICMLYVPFILRSFTSLIGRGMKNSENVNQFLHTVCLFKRRVSFLYL